TGIRRPRDWPWRFVQQTFERLPAGGFSIHHDRGAGGRARLGPAGRTWNPWDQHEVAAEEIPVEGLETRAVRRHSPVCLVRGGGAEDRARDPRSGGDEDVIPIAEPLPLPCGQLPGPEDRDVQLSPLECDFLIAALIELLGHQRVGPWRIGAPAPNQPMSVRG